MADDEFPLPQQGSAKDLRRWHPFTRHLKAIDDIEKLYAIHTSWGNALDGAWFEKATEGIRLSLAQMLNYKRGGCIRIKFNGTYDADERRLAELLGGKTIFVREAFIDGLWSYRLVAPVACMLLVSECEDKFGVSYILPVSRRLEIETLY